MPIDVRIWLLSIALGVCSGAALVSADDAAPKPGTAADSGTIPALKIRRRSLESLGVDPPELAREVDAGTIPRAALHAELSRGIGQFLRQVRLQPALAGGHFIGWRLLQLFEGRTDVHVLVLRPGDTVLRVNGRERRAAGRVQGDLGFARRARQNSGSRHPARRGRQASSGLQHRQLGQFLSRIAPERLSSSGPPCAVQEYCSVGPCGRARSGAILRELSARHCR